MTIVSSTSTASSPSVNPFAPAGPSILVGLFVPADFPAPASLVLSLYTGLPIVQDMTKLFFIEKPIIAADNKTLEIYTIDTIWISGVPFPSLDEA